MENLFNAVFLSFVIIALVIGLSYGLHLINMLNSTATTLVENNDNTKDYQFISYNSSDIEKSGNADSIYSRIVSIDTIVSMLYRYYLEDFSVEIYLNNHSNRELHIPTQIFDLEIEDVLCNCSNKEDPAYKAYSKLYCNSSACNLFYAPWMVDRKKYSKQRIDMFVSSQKGYINGTLVDYTNTGLKDYLEFQNKAKKKFREEFIQYTYDGDTISAGDEGEEIETIVGSRKAQNKIIIRYIEID